MQLNEYQAEAIKTINDSADLTYLAGKLVCEATEIFQPIIKKVYHDKRLVVGEIREELGDCLWYIAVLCERLGWNLEEIAAENISKLRERHGEKYRQEFYTGEKDGS